MRRAWGRPRFLPADLLGWPLLWAGTWLLAGARFYADRAADRLWTVRVIAAAPAQWFASWRGWAGVAAIVLGLVLVVLASRLARPGRALTASRFPQFGLAARVLAAAWVLSTWRAFNHLVDTAPGGLQWRFLAEDRGGFGNDLTSLLVAAAAVVLYAASFGGAALPRPLPAPGPARPPAPAILAEAGSPPLVRRPVAAPPSGQPRRSPVTTRAKATTSRAMATGVATQRRSLGRSRDETGT